MLPNRQSETSSVPGCAAYYRIGSIQEALASNLRYLGGVVRPPIRLIPIKWQVRLDYQEPVQ